MAFRRAGLAAHLLGAQAGEHPARSAGSRSPQPLPVTREASQHLPYRVSGDDMSSVLSPGCLAGISAHPGSVPVILAMAFVIGTS